MNIPIKIKIDDERRFTDVAFLVDRDEFLRDLQELREKKGLKRDMPYDSNKHWALDSIWGVTRDQLFKHNDAVAPFEDILQNTNEMQVLSHEQKEDLLKKYREAQRTLPGNAFEQDIQAIRDKYHKPPNFDRIIAHAVLYGEIRNEDYVTAEIDIDYPEVDIVDYDREPLPIIKIYPNVSIKDIQVLFQNHVGEVLRKYQEEVLGGKISNYDTKNNIKRDREWYWMWKEEKVKGRGLYNRIADQWNNSGDKEYIEDVNLIEQGVSRYRKFLNADI